MASTQCISRDGVRVDPPRRSAWSRLAALAPHVLAGSTSLAFAWQVFQSPYMQTSLQFVAPLLPAIVVHVLWIAVAGQLTPGFARTVVRRAVASTVGLVLAVLAADAIAPMPSHASDFGDAVRALFGVLFCLLVVAFVLAAAAAAIYVIVRALDFAARLAFGRRDDRSQDIASLAAVVAILIVASVEGAPWGYRFDGDGRGVAEREVAAPPASVWNAMATATSPDVHWPKLMRGFPQPVAVDVDEGVDLNAARVVRFEGREGSGELRLRVVDRTPRTARFQILADDTPFANWVAFKFITYRVDARAGGSRLAVALEYDRLLAPAWFFQPLGDLASHLAMDVLARDVQRRAETIDQEGLRYGMLR